MKQASRIRNSDSEQVQAKLGAWSQQRQSRRTKTHCLWSQATWVGILIQSLISCVALEKLLSVSVPQFFHVPTGNSNRVRALQGSWKDEMDSDRLGPQNCARHSQLHHHKESMGEVDGGTHLELFSKLCSTLPVVAHAFHQPFLPFPSFTHA